MTEEKVDVKAVIALDPTYWGRCALCGQHRTLCWQVQYVDGSWGDVCLDCGTPLSEKVKNNAQAS